MEKGDKKIIRGWVMYDWANSVYNLVISSAIFPIFYDIQTKKEYARSIGKTIDDLKDGDPVLVDFFGCCIVFISIAFRRRRLYGK
jgi:UMF1 family MFS transporter